MEYKVLTERDSRFSGSFDPENLERALNSYAREGWRVVSGFMAASLWKSSKSEIIIVLERTAALMNRPVEIVAQAATANAERLFGLARTV